MDTTLNHIFNSYYDCRSNKRTSKECAEFELSELTNLYSLFSDIINNNYEIGKSIRFLVTKPRIREVFAAVFRDRIIHHYVINKTNNLFESEFIADTYNCRKGKGNLYGARRIQEKIRKMSNDYTEECWILKLDIKSFFLNISKPILINKIVDLINRKYLGSDKDELIKLIIQIINYNPSTNCEYRGDINLLDRLDHTKSLMFTDIYHGLAIGNLTSQIFANYYLNEFDHFISDNPELEYGRYVDDFIIIAKSKSTLLKLMPIIRKYLKDNLELELNNKFYLQKWDKGVKFVGFVIKGWNLYTNNRTISNAINMIDKYNHYDNKSMVNKLEEFTQKYNSYSGFLTHTKSHNIRIKLWELVSPSIKDLITIKSDYSSIRIKDKYKPYNIKLNELRNSKQIRI